MTKMLLASEDFVLKCSDGKTHLTARYPTENRQIVKSDEPEDWSRDRWKELLREADRFGRDDLIDELEDLRDDLLGKEVLNEKPLFDDNAGEAPDAVHALYIHYAKGEHLKVRGTSTYEHRDELAELGLRWSPEEREWYADFSQELLDAASKYIAENDTVYDPSKIHYERCATCRRWKPQGKHCCCGS